MPKGTIYLISRSGEKLGLQGFMECQWGYNIDDLKGAGEANSAGLYYPGRNHGK